MRWAFVLVVLVAACSRAAPPPEPTGPIPPVFAPSCPAGTAAEGPACVPKFDDCDARSVPILGAGCTRVGPTCAAGFAADPAGACVPTTPDCAPPLFAVPGDKTCRPLGDCAVAFPATSIHVDASFAGTADGSASAPYPRISDALTKASDGGTVAIEAGTYEEDLVLLRPVTLLGRCAQKVRIVGKAGDPDRYIVTVRAPSSIVGVGIEGRGRGAITSDVDLIVRGVFLHDLAGRGLSFFPPKGKGKLVVRDLLVDHARTVGIAGRGTIDIEAVSMRHIASDEPSGAFGIQVSQTDTEDAQLTLKRASLRDIAGNGLDLLGASADAASVIVRDVTAVAFYLRRNGDAPTRKGTLLLSDAYVEAAVGGGVVVSEDHATVTGLSVRRTNYGAFVTKGGALELRDSFVQQSTLAGVALQGGEVALSRSIVSDSAGYGVLILGGRATVADTRVSGSGAAGIACAGTLQLRTSLLTKNVGVSVSLESAEASIDATAILDSLPLADGTLGTGVLVTLGEAGTPTHLTLTRTRVRGAHGAGLALFSSEAELADAEFGSVLAEKATNNGGLAVLARTHSTTKRPAKLVMRRSRVRDATTAGIGIIGGDATLEGVFVSGSRPSPVGGFGDGVVASASGFGAARRPATVTLSGSLIEANPRAGIAVFGGELTLTGSLLKCNGIDLDVESFYGEGRTPAPVALRDGGANICGCSAWTACAASSTGLAPFN